MRRPKKTFASNAKHKVTFQVATEVDDGEGGFTKSWTSGATVWAEVNPISAVQQLEYRSVGVDATHEIVVRNKLSITEDYRIMFGTREFEILTIENIQERGIVTIITCKERR